MPKLTKRTVDAAYPRERDYFVWCSSPIGFGVRVRPSGKKTFIAQIRVGRATRRVTIGQYGPFTVDQARTAAEDVIRKASLGVDPQREKRETRDAITVSELLDKYMEAARAGLVITRFGVPKRSSTVAIDEGRVSRHLKPLVGSVPARDLKRADVQNMIDRICQGQTRGIHKGRPRGKAVVKGGGGTAARAASLLGGVFTWAERRGYVDGPSPVRNLETIRPKLRDRILSASELVELGRAATAAEETTPKAAMAVRLLALTGLRREEGVRLTWPEVDFGGQCLRLLETKTGKSVRPIGKAAIELLRSLPRYSDKWLFPSDTVDRAADLKKEIASIFDAAGLRDARSHDLRRTFASTAADEGYSDATIAALLGHAQRNITARHYIRRPDAALVAAADRASARIATSLLNQTAEIVPLFAR